MQNFRQYCESKNIPIISFSTEKFLKDILANYKPTYCLEIGTAVGYSALVIGKEIQKWNGLVYTFELGYTSYRQALENFQKQNLFNITAYNVDFLKIPIEKYISFKFDFIFIDGAKKYYKDFLIRCLSITKPKGILILDDVIKFKNKMHNLYDFVKEKKLKYEILHLDKDDGIMIIYKS